MTQFQRFRGPDGDGVWWDESVGLGHTVLRSTFESENERQPCTHDGQVWITADARIDARTELLTALSGRTQPIKPEATDAELILHAYSLWGDACVEHIL